MSGITPEEIKSYIQSETPTILDIGANDGEQTHIFLTLFPEARVFSFEPDPRAVARYQANAHPKATLFPFAIGRVNGALDFYPSQGMPAPLPEAEAKAVAVKLGEGGWDLSGSLRKPKLHLKHHPWCQFGDPIRVPVTTLDRWMSGMKWAHVDRVDFIWADVQGAEADLIAGGLETLKRTRFLYTEYSNHELYEGQSNLDQLMAMLPDFRIVKQYPEDVLLENTQWEV